MKYLEENIAVTGQRTVVDFIELKSLGFKSIINNRPDNEMAGQPSTDELSTAAELQGLEYVHLPMSGSISHDLVERSKKAYETLPKPILAFCGSGPRSAALWCFANVHRLGVDKVIECSQAQGFQTGQLRHMLAAYLDQSAES